jgi:hypothetical protein
MRLRGLLAGFVFAAACSRDVATTAAPPELRDAQHRCRRRDRLGHRAVDDDGDVHQ